MLKQIFHYSFGFSSKQDSDDSGDDEDEISNVDKRYIYDENKKFRSKQLRTARLGKDNAFV